MDLKFDRSIIGYSPRVVELTIGFLEKEFEEQIRELESQIRREEDDLCRLREQYNQTRNQVNEMKALQEEVSHTLSSALISGCSRIAEARETGRKMEEEAQKNLKHYECGAAQMQETVNKLVGEMQSLTGENILKEAVCDE